MGTGTAATLLTLLFLTSASLSAQQCVYLERPSTDERISFLKANTPGVTNSDCIAFSIEKIGEQAYEPGIPVLMKFLSFRWPPDARQKQRRYVLEHDGVSIYPAATALERIGKSALPAVLEVIKLPGTSRETMEVAVSVWMTVYKDEVPMGVALLRQQADVATQLPAKQRLKWAAYLAARNWCNPSDQAQCKAAAGIR